MKAAVLVLAVPLAGCARVWGFDDLTVGAGDAAVNPDAPVRETGVGDSGSDVDSSSGVVSTEAATDAVIEVGGEGGSDCPGTFLMCDGFESGSFDQMKWDSPNCTRMATMDIGTTAHRGSHSLHVHVSQITDQSYGSCVLTTKQASIFASTPMYFRAWVYMTNNAGPSIQTMMTALPSSGGASANMGINSTGQFLVGVANTAANNYVHTSTNAAPLSPNNWACIELEIDTDYAMYPKGMLAAWDDISGTADPQLAGTAELQPLFATQFGLSLGGPSSAVDLYIDDIAISNTYVPCSQ
jgi:hypothetical protein